MDPLLKYSINLNFEEIKLPPFQDILILGRNSPHGIIGITKSFELLTPNGFEIVTTDHENVEALFINKRILAKIPKEKIVEILQDKVFRFVSEGEILKVDFRVNISCTIE